jgi:hypothetical protein
MTEQTDAKTEEKKEPVKVEPTKVKKDYLAIVMAVGKISMKIVVAGAQGAFVVGKEAVKSCAQKLTSEVNSLAVSKPTLSDDLGLIKILVLVVLTVVLIVVARLPTFFLNMIFS